MKKIFALSFFIFQISAMAFANGGVDVRGGGGGIKTGNQVYSYDLFDAGLQNSAYFRSVAVDQAIETALTASGALPTFLPADALTNKIEDIETLDPVLAAAVLKGIQSLTWQLVSFDLAPTADLSDDYQNQKLLVQLASRESNVVSINASLWSAMDTSNQTALVIHETLEALIETHQAAATLDQALTRQLTARLFAPQIYSLQPSDILSLLTYFPNVPTAAAQVQDANPMNYTRRAYGTGPNTPPTARFLFFPRMEIDWQANSLWSRLTGKLSGQGDDRTEISLLSVQTWELPSHQFCTYHDPKESVSGLNVFAYELQISPTLIQDQTLLPKLQWSMSRSQLQALAFAPSPSNASVVDCSQWDAGQSLSDLQAWSATLAPVFNINK